MAVALNISAAGGIPAHFVEGENDLPDEITPLHGLEYHLPLSPCRELWLESLKFAINEYLSSPVSSIQLEAAEWLNSDRTTFGSFIYICNTFGFEHEKLLNGIKRLRNKVKLNHRPRGVRPRPQVGTMTGRRGKNPYTGNLIDI